MLKTAVNKLMKDGQLSSTQLDTNSQAAADADTDEDRLKKKSSTVAEKPGSAGSRSDDGIINGEEIRQLAIKDEDLLKIRQSLEKDESVKSTKPQQTTRYSVKKPRSAAKPEPPRKKIIVARRAPPHAQMKPIDYSGPAGPRYTQEGHIVPYSIVGTVEDFVTEAIRCQDMRPDSPATTAVPQARAPLSVVAPTRKAQTPKEKIRMSINQENALLNWRKKMVDRKKQQGYISELLQKPMDRLVMNQDDKYREMQEKRHLLDRSIPAVDSGKGYRVGSEFWQQHESFGDDIGGIKMTLSKTERGEPVVFEHIGKPSTVLHEVGAVDVFHNEKTTDTRRGWHSSSYLKQRTQQLYPIMKNLVPHEPEISRLEIVSHHDLGNTLLEQPGASRYDEHNPDYPPITIDHGQSEIFNDPLAKYPDTIPEPIFGPSIMFGDQRAAWTGSMDDQAGTIGIESRVIFEAVAGQRVTSHLEVNNNGTTVVYYEWRKLQRKPAFKALKLDSKQRFYFNTAGGVVLPNETIRFPFVFKSPNAGIFTEVWELVTKPVLMGGASIQVVLRGVSSKVEGRSNVRDRIFAELAEREASVTVKQIIDEILQGVRTPERSPSPIDCYITEEEIFHRKNPGCTYDHETVLELKNLYKQLFPEEDRETMEWNLSLAELRDCVSSVPDEDAREELLSGLNSVVSRLTIPPFAPAENKMFATCHRLLQETIDGIVSCSMYVRNIMNLPDIVMEPIPDNETIISGKSSIVSPTSAREGKRGSQANSAGLSDDKKGKGGKGKKDDPKAKKGGKKDSKEKDRPKSKDPKGGKGKTATPTKEATSVEADVGSRVQSSARPVITDVMDPETRKKYSEKMYAQVYGLLVNSIDKMSMLFEDIKSSNNS